MSSILCIGAAAADRTLVLDAPLVAATSNPARAQALTFGGVARNVAENLARLGVEVALISVVGDDAEGRELIARANEAGIDTRGVLVDEQFSTAQYVAVLDPSGDLAIGVSAAQIIEAIDAKRLHRAIGAAPQSAYWFVDCNLSAQALGSVIALARERGVRLAVDGVSVAKIRRLPERLDGIHVVFCNNDEAASYLGSDLRDAAAAQALRECGAANAVVTAGARGAFACGAVSLTVPAAAARLVNVTGAGDAFVAATLFALSTGEDVDAALSLGAVAAALTVESPQSVSNDLSPTRLRARRSTEYE